MSNADSARQPAAPEAPSPLPPDAASAGAPPDGNSAGNTALTAALLAEGRIGPSQIKSFCGAGCPRAFATPDLAPEREAGDGRNAELSALLHAAAVSDLGWQSWIRVTGTDRIRWLNGMVSNAVQSLPENEGNYNFLLNAQGRIQGDCMLYRRPGDALLTTGQDQVAAVVRSLERYIIMDDVELQVVSGEWTALSIAGPGAAETLRRAIADPLPEWAPRGNARLREIRLPIPRQGSADSEASGADSSAILIAVPSPLAPRYELWIAPSQVLTCWDALLEAGARPAGVDALEALRVLEGAPRYGLDFDHRNLPQETGQTRALHFAKGCYLGQEIVERIRSQATVHRNLRQFELRGALPSLPCDLLRADQVVGRLTSAASLPLQGVTRSFGLGFLRAEAEARAGDFDYAGGSARLMAAPPLPPGPRTDAGADPN